MKELKTARAERNENDCWEKEKGRRGGVKKKGGERGCGQDHNGHAKSLKRYNACKDTLKYVIR